MKPRKPTVTVHRGGSCRDGDTCEAFTTVDSDPAGGYVIYTVVTDLAVLAAHAPMMGPGEGLGRIERELAPEVFGG